MIKTLAAVTVLSLFSLGAANAATITQSATPMTAFANLGATSATGTYAENVTSSVSGVRLSPWAGTGLDGSVYSSITGTATYVLGSLSKAISLVWGSPDSYNSIIFKNGAATVDSVSGTNVAGCCGSNVPNPFVTITASGAFDRFELVSGSPAFEYANLEVSAVPLPAGGLLLIGAMGGLAALRRRKAAAAL